MLFRLIGKKVHYRCHVNLPPSDAKGRIPFVPPVIVKPGEIFEPTAAEIEAFYTGTPSQPLPIEARRLEPIGEHLRVEESAEPERRGPGRPRRDADGEPASR